MLSALLCGSALALTACPVISEVHADSDPAPDSIGEFLEVLIPDSIKSRDPLRIWIDEKTLVESTIIAGERLVFCHQDSLKISPEISTPCIPLKASLPNSEAMDLILQQGVCHDSIWLERGKPGLSWQRDSLNHWLPSIPSPGFGMPGIESGIQNMAPQILSNELSDSGWILRFAVHGATENFWWKLHWIPLGDSIGFVQESQGWGSDVVTSIQPQGHLPWTRVFLSIEGDDYPVDNRKEILLYPPGSPPFRISEVVADPQDPWPEWVEFENQGPVALPLWILSPCIPMEESDSTDLIYPGEHVIVTDSRTMLLQASPSLMQSHILETEQAWSLANASDTVRLCLWNKKVDSVFWNKQKKLSEKKPSPGWQPHSQANFTRPKLSTRIISFSRSPSELHIKLPTEEMTWTINIWNREGDTVYKSRQTAGESFVWKPNRSLRPGPYRISLQPSKGLPIFRGVVLAP